MAGRLPLTLLAGGRELRRLVAQLSDPPLGAVVVEVAGASTERSGHDEARPSGVVDAVTDALERSPSAQRVLVVLDEHDAIGPASTVLTDGRLAPLVELDAVVVTVDAVQLATRLAAGHPVATDAGLDRLAIADRILIARGADVTPQALGAIGHLLRSLNRFGPIIAPALSPCAVDDLLDLHTWSGPAGVGPGPDQPSPFLGPHTPTTVVCHSDRPLASPDLDRWLDALVTDYGSELLRLQGSLRLRDDTRRTYLHGVGRCVVRSHGPRRACRPDDRSSVMALVGRNLPSAVIRAGFDDAQRS